MTHPITCFRTGMNAWAKLLAGKWFTIVLLGGSN